MHSHRTRQLVLALFFLSGFAALLYQVVWQRLLVFYTGSDTVSISLIVSAFMTGMGLGYLAGGQLADRSSPAQNLRYFIGAELGIMGFAAISKWLLYDFLYASAPPLGDSPVVLYLVVFGVLLVPTFLMGVSLPVLSRAFQFGDMADQTRYISLLYFINTLGASVGALVTGFILVRRLGFDNAIWVGAALNGLCVVGAGMLRGVRVKGGRGEGVGVEGVGVEGVRLNTPTLLTLWSLQYFISGLAALSLELVWFRVLETLIKSVSLTFAVLLAIYLGSMAVGTVVGSRLVRWPGRVRERAFLLAQAGLYAYTVASVAVLVNGVGRIAALRFLNDYFLSGEPILSPRFSVFTYGVVPLFLLFVPTFLMGLSFALSQSLIHDQPDEVGRRVGWLQFVNIVGSAVGAWAVTWLGFPLLGTGGLVQLIGGLGFVYVCIAIIRRYGSPVVPVVIGLSLAGCIVAVPDNARFWQLLNGLDNPKQFLFDENESSVSVIKTTPDQKSGTVFVNGLSQSGLPFQHDEVHALLGALPVLIHPRPERVAVIGLGSGGTVNGIAGRAETRQIDCFEIATNQATVLNQYAQVANDTSLRAMLRDPRLQLILRDGRYAIRNGGVLYDVIEADALRPISAYSGNVYSKEYFELIRSRLKPGGLAVTWCPTARVLNTFRAVFPHVVYCDKLVLIGSNQPIPLDWSAIMERTKVPFTTQHYARSGIAITTLIANYQPYIKALTRPALTSTEINTDLFPKDEYSIRVADRASF
ncbi:spermine synthase [Spirosoma montaniterrae]|uniref:Spermine synthase n=2 Tax=Spirosoma montaniterrae TaxID=1178516 RepID=A0A1P9X3W4_9BACT|nr:spermine synthase [Spirosoma montaniterrae]